MFGWCAVTGVIYCQSHLSMLPDVWQSVNRGTGSQPSRRLAAIRKASMGKPGALANPAALPRHYGVWTADPVR